MKLYKYLLISIIVFTLFILSQSYDLDTNRLSTPNDKINELLKSSKKAKYDYVSGIKFNGLSYIHFPYLECLPDLIISDYQEKECKDPSKKHYIDNFKYPDIRLKKVISTDNTYEVYISSNIGRRFTIEGYRDVNNDGYMDIIMMVTETSDGTILTMSPVILTKKGSNSQLQVIK